MSKINLTYSKAITELKDIVDRIENEEVEVDELLQQVNRATSLIKFCKNKLHGTQKDIHETLEELNNLTIDSDLDDAEEVN